MLAASWVCKPKLLAVGEVFLPPAVLASAHARGAWCAYGWLGPGPGPWQAAQLHLPSLSLLTEILCISSLSRQKSKRALYQNDTDEEPFAVARSV